MKPLSLSSEYEKGYTLVSNVFIDKYIKDANDAQIKIYLYLIRMLSNNLPTDISEIADTFNLTEKDVMRSIKYWEKTGIISLSSDKDGNLSGICFNELSCARKEQEEHDATAQTNTEPAALASIVIPSEEPDSRSADTFDTQASISVIRMDYTAEKAAYSLDRIKALKNDSNVKTLLMVTSQYFGRTLTPAEIKTIIFIYDRLAFTPELTDYLIEYGAQNAPSNIHFIEQTAINWYETGVDTIERAKQTIKSSGKNAYTVMGYLGKSGKVTATESAYISKWQMQYGFELAIIEEACRRTVLRVDTNRFAYADSILTNWYEKGVRTLKDIDSLDALFDTSKAQKAAAPKAAPKKDAFSSIERRDYDFSEIEKKLISN